MKQASRCDGGSRRPDVSDAIGLLAIDAEVGPLLRLDHRGPEQDVGRKADVLGRTAAKLFNIET
jgi:hypothetical protein